jgi:hypothetical protein
MIEIVQSFVVPAKAGTHTPQRLSPAAEYGSGVATLARDDSGGPEHINE